MHRLGPFRRFAGASALLGGMAWLGHTVLLATRPIGCVGAACFQEGRSHRGTEDIAWILLAAVLMLAASIASHLFLGVQRGRSLQAAALVLCATGAALLALGVVVNRGRSTGAPLWWLHDSDSLGRLLPVLGTLVLGLGILRTGAHRWLAALLVVAALVGLAFNAQDERTLLSLPVGAAWIAFGLQVLSSGRRDAGLGPRIFPARRQPE